MLGDLSIWMNRMEVSQRELAGKHRRDSMESSVFVLALGVGAGTNLQDLKRTYSPKRSPNDVSLATYFVARKHSNADVQVQQAAQVAADFNMRQAPEPVVNYREDVPGGLYPGMRIPNPAYANGGHGLGIPAGRQRKLALQPFDGKKLYHGLGSSS